MATFKLDQYIAEAKVEPYVLDLGNGEEVSVAAPTGEALVEVTETPLNKARYILEQLCGDSFDKVWAAVAPLPSSVLQSVLIDMLTHFGIVDARAIPGGSRASRRS